jgi:hypothetical protein
MPKPGIELPAAERASITAALAELDAAIAPLASSTDPLVQELLPDVLIHAEAVRTALEFDEFFNPKEFDVARELLAEGKTRASELAAGRAPGPRRPASSSVATAHGSTARSSPTAS